MSFVSWKPTDVVQGMGVVKAWVPVWGDNGEKAGLSSKPIICPQQSGWAVVELGLQCTSNFFFHIWCADPSITCWLRLFRSWPCNAETNILFDWQLEYGFYWPSTGYWMRFHAWVSHCTLWPYLFSKEVSSPGLVLLLGCIVFSVALWTAVEPVSLVETGLKHLW